MKIVFALLLLIGAYLATQQIPHYYTENFMKKPVIWHKTARKRYLNCVAHVRAVVKRGGYDENGYKAQMDRCKSTFNRTWTIHRKMI